MWPGVTSLPDYKNTFPKWPRQSLHNAMKGVDPEGINLLEVRRGRWLFHCLVFSVANQRIDGIGRGGGGERVNLQRTRFVFAQNPSQTVNFFFPQQMLEYEPCRRISALNCLRHPYFANVTLPNTRGM